MTVLLANLLTTDTFSARWDCGKGWEISPWLGYLHVCADVATFLAYFAVPCVVAYFVLGKSNVRLPRIFWLFMGLVFLSCGTVHLIEAVIFRWPVYYLSGYVKVVTALVSCTGVVVLARVMPRALALKTPEELERQVVVRKQVEASLETERYLLHVLLDHLPDAIYFKDTEGQFIRVSKSLARRLELADPDHAIGKSDRDFFEAGYAEQARRDEEKLMRAGEPMIGKEERPTWPNGERQWVLTTKAPLVSPGGKTIGTFGISHDISAQKRTLEKLQASEERYELAVKGSSDGLWDWNVETNEVYFAPRFKELIGFQDHEMASTFAAWEVLLHPEDHDVTLAAVDAHLQRRLPYDVEYRLRTRPGAYRWYRARGQATWNERGKATRMSGSITDVTDRKDAERAMLKAKDEAESANRAKSDFLANVSHEIRTPMNAIIGLTELVIGTELTSAQRDYLTTVLESAESLLAVINEILDFSKIEAGKVELDVAPFSLREDLGDAIKALGVRAHDKGLELAWQVGNDVPDWLLGDTVRLRQVMVNLVGNAIKFTEQGEVIVQVTCLAQSETEVDLRFAVSDTGIGIPQEKIDSIFHAFEQADASTTRKHGGTGLGLAISASLIEMMQGKVEVESAPGRGSTFSFTAHFGVPETADQERPVSAPALEGVSVLIVDDNQTNRLILQEVLRGWKMQPTSATGAVEALECLKERERDGDAIPLVITDVNMPEVDGFGLVEKIRTDAALAATAVVTLTSGNRASDLERGEKLRVVAQLLKPVKQSELFNAVVEALQPGAAKRIGQTLAASPKAPLTMPPLRILLAEDGIANQKLAVGLLEKWGHSVTVANNGQEAIEHYCALPFDVVLMDVQMPEMDGYEATGAIRKHEAQTGAHVPIIAMTAHAMKGDRERCLQAGMDNYLAKPIRADALWDALQPSGVESRENVQDFRIQLESAAGLNWATALEMVQGDTALMKTLVEAALEEFPRLVEQLTAAIQEQEASKVRRFAHTLRGSLRYFDARAIPLAEQLETKGKENNLSGAQEICGQLRGEMEKILLELSEQLESL